MKQTFLALTAGCILTTLLSGTILAQDPAVRNAVASAQTGKPKTEATTSYHGSGNTDAGAAINLKAIHDFKGRYAEAREEKWSSEKNGFLVYFSQDGFRNRAYYDKKGHWQYSLTFCAESKLPRDIRAVVKRTYYDFSIALVEIVEVPDHVVYLVHLEDATQYKIARVSEEGEMDIIQEYVKG